jgi:hypothetical protein
MDSTAERVWVNPSLQAQTRSGLHRGTMIDSGLPDKSVHLKGPRSGRMSLAGPFKARTRLCLKIPSRQRRMSSSVADATLFLLPILCRP